MDYSTLTTWKYRQHRSGSNRMHWLFHSLWVSYFLPTLIRLHQEVPSLLLTPLLLSVPRPQHSTRDSDS